MGTQATRQTYLDHPADLLDLVGDIYQAGVEPERWPNLLKRLSVVFEADLACIYTPTVARPEQAIYLTHHFDDSAQAAYSGYFHRQDAWTQSARERSLYRQGHIAFGEQLITQQALHRTEFYADFLKPNGMEWIITTALFDGQTVPDTSATHMTFTRHADHAAFEPDHVGLIELIAPHVRRALLTHWRLSEARMLQTAQETALAQMGYGLALVDAAGRVLHANPLAERIVRAADGLAIQAGLLRAGNPHDNEALARLIREACLGLGGGLCVERSSRLISGQGARPPYRITATPLRERGNLGAILPDYATAGPVAMLMLHDPEQGPTRDGIHQFATAHHITPAEQRIIELLLHDRAPKQIAEDLGVAIRTVRTQLSSVFTKTGTRNQRELVKAVLGQGSHEAPLHAADAARG